MADYTNPEDIAAQSAIARQQKLAEMLFAQGAQQPQGQLVSGQYVKSSPLQFLNNIANQYAGLKTSEAAKQYKKAIQLSPEDADAYNNLGNVQRELGDLNASIASGVRLL